MGRNDEYFIINAKPDNNFFEFFSWYKILNNFKPDYSGAPKLEWVNHAKIFACFTHSFSSPGKYNIAIKRKGGLQMSTLLEQIPKRAFGRAEAEGLGFKSHCKASKHSICRRADRGPGLQFRNRFIKYPERIKWGTPHHYPDGHAWCLCRKFRRPYFDL